MDAQLKQVQTRFPVQFARSMSPRSKAHSGIPWPSFASCVLYTERTVWAVVCLTSETNRDSLVSMAN
eukprot:2521402-Rhodomonas_salina.1